MRKTEAPGKAVGLSYCRHLRKWGKRVANKATRRHGKKIFS